MRSTDKPMASLEGPCPHMERLLHETASGRPNWLIRWYVLAHAARCGRCGRFLDSLTSMIRSLRASRHSETDQAAIDRLSARLK